MNSFPAVAPSYVSETQLTDAAKLTKFGDGYEQRAPDGLNHQRLKLSVVYQKRTSATVATVLAFLKAQGTAKAFLWTAPAPFDDKQRQWILRTGVNHRWESFDSETLTFAIEEDFNPA